MFAGEKNANTPGKKYFGSEREVGEAAPHLGGNFPLLFPQSGGPLLSLQYLIWINLTLSLLQCKIYSNYDLNIQFRNKAKKNYQ